MTTEKLFSFIENSPTAFHAIEAMRCRLKAEGYQPLLEGSDWNLQAGGKYYVIRNGSSIIAFRIPAKEWKGFQIMASHSDSPMFKIKENPEIEAEGHYVKLNVEKYGGMLCAPWFDRPLSVAGRLVVKDGEQIVTKLVDVKKDLVMIPSLAIHMNRDANNGVPFNPQKDLLPLYGDENAKGTFMERMRDDDILMITADHGCDPGFPGTDHTREHTPFLVYGKSIREDVNLGTRESFADIAATILDIFNVENNTDGTSMKEYILKK